MSKKYIETPTGKVVPATDEMLALRDNLARGLGYELKAWMVGEGWEKTWPDGGKNLCRHVFHGGQPFTDKGDFYQYPEEVTKAAHAIDKSKAPKGGK